ncbi:methyltransferase-like protein 25B isoform X1 [Pleurodeles waltl]|uniref:methyltransferase-like protein 25B isoform X1 n=1 Tax=Pleurodeles waltl TaxID=8319 RepID=UPI0037098DF0
MADFHSHPFPPEEQKLLALNITRVLSVYGYIADSYIIEFFTDGLWEKLPPSWQMALHDLPSPMLSTLLLGNKEFNHISYRSVWPLSLLALKVAAQALAYPRTPKCQSGEVCSGLQEEFQNNHCQNSLLNHIFRKHVKPKKQHEIRQLGKLVKQLSHVTGCEHVVDVGSGQGHLSRFLSFGLDLSITAVEADEHLVRMATKFDQQLVITLQKEREKQARNLNLHSNPSITFRAPRHVLGWVNPRASWEEFAHLLDSFDYPTLEPSKIVDTSECQVDDAYSGVYVHNFQAGSSDMVRSLCSQPSNKREASTDDATTCHENHSAKHGKSRTKTQRQTSIQDVKTIGYPFVNPSINLKSKASICQKNCTMENGRPSGCCATHKKHGVSSVNTLSPLKSRCVLTGLHACGDLSVAMLRHFARCHNVVGITSVACCYMKLTTQETPRPPGVLFPPMSSESVQQMEFGYPLSTWVSKLPGHQLSYKSRELSCHAIEDYCSRLMNESTSLSSHCFRAVLETVIRDIDPTMKRVGVQTIKKSHKLSFEEYAYLGLERLGLRTDIPLDGHSIKSMLNQSQNVVAYFSLALLLAPLIETLILLDRMIFLHEQGFHCELIPLFDPKRSPRNLVLVAAKPKEETA